MRRSAKFLLAVALTAIVAGLGALLGGPDKPRNVLLIVVDTLRADHLGLYGYERDTSPRIDKQLGGGAVFERAYSSAPWTAPAVSSLLTSLPVRDHGLVDWDQPLAEEHLTLTELLEEQGYQTVAVVSHSVLRPGTGFEQGFGVYDFSAGQLGSPQETVSSRHVTKKALEALDGAEEPFFLMLHYFDPHNTYMPHEAYDFGTRKMDLYDGEIAFTDHAIGRVLRRLEHLDLADDTLVVLIADHGEEFRDHGGSRHSNTLYEELVHVPLIIRGPGIEAQRVTQVVRNIDVAPTILSLLGLEVPAAFQGQVIPLQAGLFRPPEGLLAFFETRRFANLRGLVQGDLKLIHDAVSGQGRVYDLATDPGEKAPLPVEDYPELTALLAEHTRRPLYAAPRVELTDEQLLELQQLGYLE